MSTNGSTAMDVSFDDGTIRSVRGTRNSRPIAAATTTARTGVSTSFHRLGLRGEPSGLEGIVSIRTPCSIAVRFIRPVAQDLSDVQNVFSDQFWVHIDLGPELFQKLVLGDEPSWILDEVT